MNEVIKLSGEYHADVELLLARIEELTPPTNTDPISWGAPKTVRQLIAQLSTLDQDLEPKTMHRIPDYKDGRQGKAYHLSTSNERVDGTGDFLVHDFKKAVANGEGRAALAFWTKVDPRPFEEESK